MIKNLSILFATLLTATIAHAKISPVYEVLRIIDEATQAMAEHLEVDQDDLEISNIKLHVLQGQSDVHVASAREVTVTVGRMSCVANIHRKNPPPGMIGGSLLSATISKSGCRDLWDVSPKSIAYGKIAPKLSKAASEGKLISAIQVTETKAGKAKLKLVYAK